MTADIYAAAVRDEIWIGGSLVESRLSLGEAHHVRGQIVATDRLSDPSLRELCDAEAVRVREIVREIHDARVRIVIRATSDEPLLSTVGIMFGDLSIVTTPQFALGDAAMLRHFWEDGPSPGLRPPSPRKRGEGLRNSTRKERFVAPLPATRGEGGRRRGEGPHQRNLVWRNGTAAILLHEAAGHASEHGHAPLRWPAWLRVHDGAADLLAGVSPHALRRESFRDVPMRRMTNVVVEQRNGPFAEPPEAIEILLIKGGSYEPLTEMVTIDVAVPPMTIRASRDQVAASLIGASGDPIRYPGVICSREGQELFVGSHAPVIVTEGLG